MTREPRPERREDPWKGRTAVTLPLKFGDEIMCICGHFHRLQRFARDGRAVLLCPNGANDPPEFPAAFHDRESPHWPTILTIERRYVGRTGWAGPAGLRDRFTRAYPDAIRHQWWCGGREPCACTAGWREEQMTDLATKTLTIAGVPVFALPEPKATPPIDPGPCVWPRP